MSACARPAPFEALVAYWAGDLASFEHDALEEHLFGCAACSSASARVAAITERIRQLLPPLLTLEAVERLRAQGVRLHETTIAPGQQGQALFAPGTEVVVLRLEGLDPARGAVVRFVLRPEDASATIFESDHVPVEGGAIRLVCQRHFEGFPPDVVAEVHVRDDAGRDSVAEYRIHHVFQ